MQTPANIQSQIAAIQAEAQAKVAELQKQAAAARKENMANAIRDVKQLMAQHGLTVADLGGAGAKVPKTARAKKASSGDARAAVAPKYRDNATGDTWTGRGKSPKWLAAKLATGATKEQFLIK
jgi:DNA-binding protein H-NS